MLPCSGIASVNGFQSGNWYNECLKVGGSNLKRSMEMNLTDNENKAHENNLMAVDLESTPSPKEKPDTLPQSEVTTSTTVTEDLLEEKQPTNTPPVEIQEGMVLHGVIKALTKYGAFVNLGQADGLVHIRDMAWKRVQHPKEMVNIGDEVDVKVLKVDIEQNRISLGMKQLMPNPWIGIAQRYPKGTRWFGKVTKLIDYGCFVELDAGIEGLVHVSEMDWTHKNVHPSRIVQVGDEVEVMVLDSDEKRRRIALGIKQCCPNPWEEFAATHNKYDKLVGHITSITNFGIFVRLEGGIDGLVHFSDIFWDTPTEEAMNNYKRGDEIEVMVLGINPERQRISLGIKQLEEDTLSERIAEYPIGSLVKGTVNKIEEERAILQIAKDVEGYIRVSQLAHEHVENIRSVLQEGDEVEAILIGVDRKERCLILSLKAKETNEY